MEGWFAAVPCCCRARGRRGFPPPRMLHCSTNTTTRNRPCCGWCTLLSVFIHTDRKKYYPLFLGIRTYVQKPPVCDHIFRCVCINKHPILDTCVLAHKMCVFPSFTTNITGKQMVDGGDLQCFRFGRGYRAIMCIELHIFVFRMKKFPAAWSWIIYCAEKCIDKLWILMQYKHSLSLEKSPPWWIHPPLLC